MRDEARRINKFLKEENEFGYWITKRSIERIINVDWLIKELEVSKEQLREFLTKNKVLSEEFDFLLSSSGELEWVKPVIKPPLNSKEEKIFNFLKERIKVFLEEEKK